MKTSKLCLVTLDYPPETGGVASYLGGLVREAEGAIEVIVPRGHALHGPGHMTERRMFWPVWPSWWPIVRIVRHRRREGQVVLVSHAFPVGTAAWVSRLLGGPEYGVIFHGLDVRLAQGAWKRFLLRRICRKAKAVFAASEATKRSLLERVPGLRVIVTTPGVESVDPLPRSEARDKLGLSHEAKVVLSLARLVPRKGLDVAIEAMGKLQQEGDVTYAVAGDGPDAARLREVEGRVGAHVTWVGKVDDMTKRLWFSAADVFVLPVRDLGHDVEGFGIVYLEAALHGMPSVAGSSGGAVEAVLDGETGLLVDPSDADAVAGAVRGLLDDEDRRELLGAQGRIRAQRDFGWSERWDVVRKSLL